MSKIILTPEYRSRTEQALKETETALDVEQRHSEALQNKARIHWLQQHIKRLQKALENGAIDKTFTHQK